MNAMLFGTLLTLDEKAERLLKVARSLLPMLLAGTVVDRVSLTRLMTTTFGTSDAGGVWTMRDAYDAIEAAQVLAIGEPAAPLFAERDPKTTLAQLAALTGQGPTHRYRSEAQIELQQFSTPAAVAYLAALAGAATRTDIVLEPSAGTGMLSVHAARAGATLLLNELDIGRAALLARLFPAAALTRYDAATLADRLPGARPTLILMNPPFSRSAGIGVDAHAGARHLRTALQMLAPGGRCVAVMPGWLTPGGSGEAGYDAVCHIAAPQLDMRLAPGCYDKHGTGIDVRLMVFDQGRTTLSPPEACATLAAALARLVLLPPRLDTSGTTADGSADTRRSASPLAKPASRGLLGGLMSVRSARPQPLAPRLDLTGGPLPLTYTARETPLRSSDIVGIYSPYLVSRIAIAGAATHPTPLVESLAMASVLPPLPDYVPLLPAAAVVAQSEAQLETVIAAGAAFERDLPGRYRPTREAVALEEHDGGECYRTGFFLGDGTGAGKGRQVAGIVMDQWMHGRRRHLWISKTSALLEDAQRDWTALGGISLDIQSLDSWPLGKPVTMSEGILFATYATLRSARPDKGSRIDQIVAWLGGSPGGGSPVGGSPETFEGMVVFDEAHAMANAAGTVTTRGVVKGSDQGLAGLKLQHLLPRARVLYVSATGATDIANLSYATRLGLWGTGTAFSDRNGFMQQLRDGGMAAMELVARDLKAMGLYTARALSFDGVEYDILEHTLTPAQIAIYDTFAGAWELIHQNLDDALAATNITDGVTGDTLNGQAKGAALSRFESTKQRFFAQLLMSMKLPSLLPAIEADLANGHAAIIQLVSTAEAMLDRRLADLSADERASLDIDLSPREYVIDYLVNAFPIRAMTPFVDDEGFLRSRPATDDHGNPILCTAAIAARDQLIEQLCGLPAVTTALDEIIRHFGTDVVAEVTGRSRRLLTAADGSQSVQSRTGNAKLGETSAFMDDRKQILVFSDAGGTGRSYHADMSARNQRRRVHYLLEPGWRADVAIQGLGRSHRTHQASAPLFRPVTTDVKGEKRFISTIARRLDALGALTRGQRQTGGQNLFDPADNLESDVAREALTQWYHLVYANKLQAIGLEEFERRSGLVLESKDGGLKEELPPIQRWLNRLLAFPIALQNAVFDEYLGLIETRLQARRDAGCFDLGVEAITAERIVVLDDILLRVDPTSKAETHLLRLETHRRSRVTSLEQLHRLIGNHNYDTMRNARSNKVAAIIRSRSLLGDDGGVTEMVELLRPTGSNRQRRELLTNSHWEFIDNSNFEQLWAEEAAAAALVMDVETINVATGLLLPVWNKLPGDDVRVWRISAPGADTVLGRLVDDADLPALSTAMGITITVSLTPAQIIAAATERRKPQPIGGELTLTAARVNGSQRLELKGFAYERLAWFKSLGCFTEVIAYKTRLFCPTGDKAEAIIARLLPATEAAVEAQAT